MSRQHYEITILPTKGIYSCQLPNNMIISDVRIKCDSDTIKNIKECSIIFNDDSVTEDAFVYTVASCTPLIIMECYDVAKDKYGKVVDTIVKPEFIQNQADKTEIESKVKLLVSKGCHIEPSFSNNEMAGLFNYFKDGIMTLTNSGHFDVKIEQHEVKQVPITILYDFTPTADENIVVV